VKKRFLIAGGGSPEAECALKLTQWSKTLTGVRAYCARAFAEVLFLLNYCRFICVIIIIDYIFIFLCSILFILYVFSLPVITNNKGLINEKNGTKS
jgi:hypothetical protein